MTKEKRTYRLYATRLTTENLADLSGERFVRATAFPEPYILVYTDKDAPKNGVEIENEREDVLSDADKLWLCDCQCVALMDAARNNPDAIQDMSQRIVALESELQRQRAALSEKGDEAT